MNNELTKYDIEYKERVSLKDFTTLHIGGAADIIVFPKTIDEIKICISIARIHQVPFQVIGRGSNILALDKGYQGMIILLSDNFADIELLNCHQIKVQAGATLKALCDYAYQSSLTGLEFACGIPGTVGGAIYMNAGAYGGEMKDVVECVTYLDESLRLITLHRDRLKFAYRQSHFTQTQGIIVEVVYQLSEGEPHNIEQKMRDLMRKRYSKQPMEDYSAGSTFKRPDGHYASALIKQCGLQGLNIGDAEVSRKHAGFLINRGHATSDDFLKLVQTVQEEVLKQTGYQLTCEVQILETKDIS